MNESQSQSPQAVNGTGGLQRRSESREAEVIKAGLRQNIKAIREGHLTGGYCKTEELVAEEKKLHAILSKELETAKRDYGYSPDPKFKHPTIRAIEVELHGLAFKPKLVVAD